MVAKSYQRGHPAIFVNNEWCYEDGESAQVERPCIRCGKFATANGYDACLGYVADAEHACCGHGVKPMYIKYKKEC